MKTLDSVWGQSVINLTDLGVVPNSTLQLRWEFGSDECNGKDGWYIDEIIVYNCSQTLSINDVDFLNKNIDIYPNPSAGIFNIEMKNISDFHYEIFDISGKSITNKIEVTLNSFEINLSKYSHGIYFLKLQSNEGVITKKLIVK